MKIFNKERDDRTIRHLRLLIMLAVLAIMLTTVTTLVSAHLYTTKTRELRIKTANGTARLAADSINADEIDNWLINGVLS